MAMIVAKMVALVFGGGSDLLRRARDPKASSLDPFKSSNARLKSLASRHWGQTRRIAVSRVDILISVARRARRQSRIVEPGE